MASLISSSDGRGVRSSSAVAVMIMPGVQHSHWRPCSSLNPCCKRLRSAPLETPSIVVTSCPFALTASTVQDLTGSPSRCTVHAPQLEVSHPQWVPVSPRVSRMKWTSKSRGSTSASRVSSFPFTCILIALPYLPPSPGPARRAPARDPACTPAYPLHHPAGRTLPPPFRRPSCTAPRPDAVPSAPPRPPWPGEWWIPRCTFLCAPPLSRRRSSTGRPLGPPRRSRRPAAPP